MLKFSGYSRLIRGRIAKDGDTEPQSGSNPSLRVCDATMPGKVIRPTTGQTGALEQEPSRALSLRHFLRRSWKQERLKSTADERDCAHATRQCAPQASSGCDYVFADPRTGEAPAVSRSRNVRSRCRCSVCPAIHINSRSWLRSSSTHEPSDPPHRVVNV